jgi:hypothetical protein
MDVYQHVLPGMGEQVATAIEAALAASSAASPPRMPPDGSGRRGTVDTV